MIIDIKRFESNWDTLTDEEKEICIQVLTRELNHTFEFIPMLKRLEDGVISFTD